MNDLRRLLHDAAHGRFPRPDGSVELTVAPGGLYSAALIAFTGHIVIATDLPPDDVLDALDVNDLAAAFSPPFFIWLTNRLGARPGNLDLVLAGLGRPGMSAIKLERQHHLPDHPRVARAHRNRDEVSVYSTPDRAGMLILGRGLAGRRELAIEVEEGARARGLGREMVMAARGLVEPGEPLFAQVAPGNAASIRAILGAGLLPIGAEVLFARPSGSTAME